ncbi:efflux transporter outer membrane subunit [Lunatibacter salilacus]|uniref:efflux transporter outer membrane subunit n=1 Tax=Lunatibacter salilacus TaxID=2483804 RepID=UPI00131DAE89|nr:efflux transporter outer membrane subunit [Lunatibacter salilacus]
MNNYTIYILVAIAFSFSCNTAEQILTQPAIPVTYVNDALKKDSANWAMISWESFFRDEALKELIQDGLSQNQDVLKTLYRIQISQASLRQARLGRLPELNLQASTGVRRFGEYTMDGVGNTDSNLSPTVPEDKMIPDPYRDFLIGLDFSWEVDIWGKLKMRKRQALMRYLESEEMLRFTQTNLIANIATTYFLISGLEEQIMILNKNISVQEDAFELGKSLKEAGQDSQLSLDQFEALLLNSKGLLLQKNRELQQAKLNLSQLTGSYSTDFSYNSLEQTELLPEVIEAGVPADLIRMRPDIRAAEMNLQAQHLEVGIARTAFFPSLNLSGLVGYNAFDFSRLFLNPASAIYHVGGGLSAPIFNRKRIDAMYQTAKAEQKIALYNFEQTVLRGYLEVMGFINDYQYLSDQILLKTDEVIVQKRSIENSSTMFKIGYADYLDVINSQSRSLEAELDFVKLRVEQFQSYVDLYKALGGGWM